MGVHDVIKNLVDAPLLRFRSASHQPPFLLCKANGPRDRRNQEPLIFYSMPHQWDATTFWVLSRE